ncbi:ABC transporter substrate-binding protein [Streptomyces europaeiscabiei]|uniref:ABC transporter substrate-binding protein n=1 Tax=Streptomyces europaeiscabiei TaxID=146819 RepID=A0ABU4NCD8_9ACTN|nr:ABC transporter substrate-binding protein [Streptomyces europaeiscabiei]MDX2761448.1 ABC transporter substrate-binding protein [Streptomyces europaeiscabiei]MDX3543285.1 ABC transporter substrate-binding protein [Streptomyces europaeiscabiei]MDX3553101.1 ABC transporter substrate-binding protein [Streptomyces europaeiscabiei]MDX3700455.1 ABC transporter substrate-binding protein [Streptomyces europaeiscabiei]MDX3843083.1 ABC transporter substrate-binding protein [Streptomyces europaeiscabie
MKSLNSRRARAIVVAVAAGSLVLTACSENTGGNSGTDSKKDQKKAAVQSKAVTYADAAASEGPAAEVAGAKSGGTVEVYQEAGLSHLDSGQIYVSDGGQVANLIYRGLTNFQEDDKGNMSVVGDLATDSGTSSDGGKTWTYTLKDGVKDQNGNEITSADVRHTVERMYAEFIFDGPNYLQTWLSGAKYREALPDGGYGKKHLPDSVLETPDDKTVVFHFDTARPDLPQTLAMSGYSIVPEKTDTKEKYDKAPVSLGPYKISEYKVGKSLKLVKNDQWDAKTDPVRHQYVDGWNFDFGVTESTQTKRLIADQGASKNAIQFTGSVESTQIQNVITDPAVNKRTIKGYQPYVMVLNFNLDRVKNKAVRDAITYAVNSKSLIAGEGGAYGGDPAPNLFAPTLPGYEAKYDPYGRLKTPSGNIEKAKELLKDVPASEKKIVFAYRNNENEQKRKVALEDALTKVGIEVVGKEIDAASFYEQIGKVKNPYDVYITGWGQDWPSAGTVVTPIYDGDQVADGAPNYSHVNDPKVQELIKKALGEEPTAAQKTWQEAHHYILEKINPAAPLWYAKQFQLYGSNIGGARYSTESSYIDVNNLFLKS